MNEVRTLIENFWVVKDQDKDMYYRVKRDIPNFRKFVRELLGWRLISNEQLLKLEKIPAHAESFMGITEFQDIRDYCILCAILIFLEDKEEQEQFLLSELVDFIGLQLKNVMEVDWNSFSQRKSLVRSLQYVEGKGILKAYDMRIRAVPDILHPTFLLIFQAIHLTWILRKKTETEWRQIGDIFA